MTASLIVAGFETYDNSVDRPVQLSGLGWIPGDPLPDQATIEQKYLDGEAVTGSRTRNRTMRIPVWVRGFDALDLAANVNALWQAVTTDTFTVQWTPNGGLPIIFDCYHATVTKPNNTYLADQFTAAVMIECQAKPFGRSDVTQQMTAGTAQLQVDNFATARTNGTLDTTVKYEGTGSNRITLTQTTNHTFFGTYFSYSNATAKLAATFAAKDLSTYATMSVRFRWGPLDFSRGGAKTLSANLVLTDSGAHTLTIGSPALTLVGGSTPWYLIGFTLPSSLGAFDLTQVTGYSLEFDSGAFNLIQSTTTAYVDDLRALPSGSAQITTTHAEQVLVPGITGSARTPANVAITNGGTFTSMLLHTPPAEQDPDASILLGLSGASTDQTVTVAAANAAFAGTYAVILGCDTIGGGSVTATVTVTQKENGTTVGSSKVVTKTYTSGAALVPVGEITLPLYATPADNTGTTYTVRVQITGLDRYTELMLLDTAGQTVFTDSNLAAAAAAVYVDEPSPLQSGSSVYASATDRTAAFGVLGNCFTSGGPILLEPGANKFLAWVSTNTPVVTTTYYPRWPFERAA